jgi:glutathione synthase/RimK-type ligase-like ATP-grasp enzyme
MTDILKIAVGVSDSPWDQRFAAALDEHISRGEPVRYDLVDLRRSDWIRRVEPYGAILWKSTAMGIEEAEHYKEKTYFLEAYLGKMVVPNYNSIWHFESKVAQSYLLAIANVPTPATIATFNHYEAEARIQELTFPVVFKRSEGAGSRNVQLVKSQTDAMRRHRQAFAQQMFHELRAKGGSLWCDAATAVRRRWFWKFLWQCLTGHIPQGHLYWQEFLAGNDADLRIAAIGDRCAYGFWRRNRPNDFRASGSGRIDYDRTVPEEALRMCLALNRRFDFDSMAYDILLKDDQFVISEMSYGYLDVVPYRTAGYFRLHDDGQLEFVKGHVWPQSLWAEWTIERWNRRRSLETGRQGN